MNKRSRGGLRRAVGLAVGATLSAPLLAVAYPATPALADIGTGIGDILITDILRNDVIKVNPSTGAQRVVASGGVLDFPTSLAVRANGDLLVASSGVTRNDQPAEIIRVDHLTGQQQVLYKDFTFDLKDITVAADGGIIAVGVDRPFADVLRIDPATREVTTLAQNGLLRDPAYVAIESDGSILVADQLGSDSQGTLIRINPKTGSQTEAAAFDVAGGLALQRDGQILLSERNSGFLFRINPKSGSKATIASGDRIRDIDGMAIDAGGNLVASSSDRTTSQSGVLRINLATGTSSFLSKGGEIENGGGIAVAGVNEIPPSPAPIAKADSYTFSATTGAAIAAPGVLANDTDPQGDPLKARIVTTPNHGLFSLHPDGSFEYVDNGSFVGTDSFSYRAEDPAGNSSNIVTVTLNAISGVAPRANDDAFTFRQGENVSIPAPGVLKNDTDPNGDPLRAKVLTQPSHGLLSLGSDGAISYVVNPSFIGTDSFSYTASDGTNTSNFATVRLTFTGNRTSPSGPGVPATTPPAGPAR